MTKKGAARRAAAARRLLRGMRDPAPFARLCAIMAFEHLDMELPIAAAAPLLVGELPAIRNEYRA